MKNLSILIAGFGGQGVLFAGKVIAYAGMLDGRHVSWLPSYGPEMRGGTANCGVCISDQPIGSPLIAEPDVLLAMNTPSFLKFIGALAPDGLALVDGSLVDMNAAPVGIPLIAIPAAKIATEERLSGISNMIMLGALLKATGFTTMETLKSALIRCVPEKHADLLSQNMKALRVGAAYVTA